MKKIFFALLGVIVLLSSCAKDSYYIEQNPYRKIIEYAPSTFTMDVPGDLTPITEGISSWITMSVSGKTATFTVRRNTTGLIRRAEYKIAGGGILAISQRAHSLDAVLSTSLKSQTPGAASVNVILSSSFVDDYESWGIIYGKENDMSKGKDVPQAGKPAAGVNLAAINDLEDNTDYFVWAYVISTEGDKIYTKDVLGIIPPVFVTDGAKLQEAIAGAKDFAEVRLIAGATVPAPLYLRDNVAVSGGWNADFSEKDINSKNVIDGAGTSSCVFVGVNPADKSKYQAVNCKIENFEIRNGDGTLNGGHGAAILVCGQVVVKDCWIHDCFADGTGAAIYLDNAGRVGDLTLVNCLVENNKGTGHGAALFTEETATITLIGNIIIDNECWGKDGYSGAIMANANTTARLINNTFVNNTNFPEYGNDWESINIRKSSSKVLYANNIVAHNRYFPAKTSEEQTAYREKLEKNDPSLTPHSDCPIQPYAVAFQDLEVENVAVLNNLFEGNSQSDLVKRGSDAVKALVSSATFFKPLNFDLSTILDENWNPKGDIVGAGSLDGGVSGFLATYPDDIYGNPRVSNGKVSIGAVANK
ncbi:MAG: right-handed parallel beta-helix repeat-containing protein [Bacteroidales bacterium]|nr:right-handed parallel beta-helix repeat-containing protein [Bacteroidales bacterium]